MTIPPEKFPNLPPDSSDGESDGESAADLESSLDPEELRSAREVLMQLNKTSKTLKIYLPNNPIYTKFLDELQDRLNAHLRDYETLDLHIRQFEMLYHGEVVYENDNRLESLAFKLYIDGIREFAILEGIDKDEIISLLDILGRDYDPTNPDDDMVTLLWEGHFTHVRYRVTDDFIEEAAHEVKPLDPGCLGQVMENEAVTEISKDVHATSEETLQEYLGPQLAEEASHVFILTENEIAWIKEQIKRDEAKDPLSTLLNILGAILTLERDDDEFAEMVRILCDFTQTLVLRGDFHHAVQIMKFFRKLCRPEKKLSKERTGCLQMAIEQVGEPKQVQELESILNHWGTEETEPLFEYLRQLNPNATYPLVELLGHLTQMKIRRLVCEALTVVAKPNPEPLIQRLTDSRWFVVRNLIFILGKIGDERVVDHFRPLVEHREIKVRKELIHTLETFKGPKAQELLRWFLDDPDSQIRVQALRILAQNGYQGALETLEDMIEEPSFLEKELFEKKEVFEAIGRIGGEQVIPLMRQYIKKGKSGWFNKGPNEELGVCAVTGLKAIATEEAKAILKQGQGYSNKNIQEACRKALLEISRPARGKNV